jgi:hypothetical protein
MFVGRGMQKCYGLTPGRITVGGDYSPGVYFPCSGKEISDKSETAEFLVKNDSQVGLKV